MTLNELFGEFVQYKKHIGMKISSLSTYARTYDAKIRNSLGDVEIETINEAVISNFLIMLLSTNLSRRYIKNISVLLFCIIGYAKLKHPQFTKLNGIQPLKFKMDKAKIVIFTEEEQRKIEQCILSDISSVNLGILLSLYTGIRNGELCALKLSDFDMELKTVNINYTLQRVKNTDENATSKTKIIIAEPKSKSSVRTIPIPEFFIPMLSKIFLHKNKDNFFLTLSQHKFIEPRTLENIFKRMLESIYIPNKKFHVLRHTFANNMLDIGVDIKTLSEILGHSSVVITMNEYIHPSLENKAKQIDLLNQKFISNHAIFDKIR